MNQIKELTTQFHPENMQKADNAISKNSVLLTIDEVNQERLFNNSDKLFFMDVMYSNFKKKPEYPKAELLFKIVEERQISSTAFRKTIIDFIADYEYPEWRVANILKYYLPKELHNEDWYKQQIAKDYFPEHFEVFLVDGIKYYCHKAYADSVKLSSRVKAYKPLRIAKKIQQEAPIERTDYDIQISKQQNKIFGLEAENERLKSALIRKEK